MAAYRTTALLLQGTKTIHAASKVPKNIPGVWQRGVSEFFDSDILPQSLGGKPENEHLAWYGDKILGVSVAKSFVGLFGASLDRGVATKICSTAVSNSFMRQHFDALVPILAIAQDIQPKLTNENAGTIIETGVARLYMQNRSKEINDLSDWLMKEAMVDVIKKK
jgi:hypothetical protein